MKIKSIIISLFLSLFLISPAPGRPGEFKIHYNLEVVNTSSSLTKITACFKNVPAETVTLAFYPHYGSEKCLRADNVEVMDDKGKNIEFYQYGNKYIISNGSRRNFTVTYFFTMNQISMGPLGYLCDTYLLSSCAWTFLVPENPTAGEYSVGFNLPSGWTAVTPFQKKNNIYIEKDFYKFISSTYGAGTFDVREENINGTNVKIAIDSHFGKGSIDKMSKNCFIIFRYLKSLFEAQIPPAHLTIIARATGQNQYQFFNEGSMSNGEAIENINTAYFVFQHRVFHTFNGFYPYGMDIKPTWFMEGVDEYYYTPCLMKIRYGRPFQDLAYRYKQIYLKEKGKFDGPVYGDTRFPDNFDKEQFLGYKKSSLVAYLLDREIRKATSGKKSLDDVLKILYKTYGSFKKSDLTDDVIERSVSKVAGKDMSYFFNNYIHNTGNLQLDKLFSDNDEDGFCNGAEEYFGTDAGNPDTDGDSVTDYLEYKYNTDPLNKDSRPFLPLYVDGFPEDWNSVDFKSLDATDNTEMDYMVTEDALYIVLKLKNGITKDDNLRYVINMDLNGDYIPDIQVASIYGTGGDTLKYRKDLSTYDWKVMDDVEGLESAMSKVIEFKIPLSMLVNKRHFNVNFGIGDIRTLKTLEGSGWLEIDF